MIIQNINEDIRNEFKFIISLLKSNDKESVYLGVSLLKEYPYTMMCEFDASSFDFTSSWRSIGPNVESFNIRRVISILEEILEDGKYYYRDSRKHKITPVYHNYENMS